ncbi:hypothetical protein TRIATDRAFT_258103 [Trichoderma atroviride IMI 206040]|uniref:Uncharacterized protein n=1 Tax=Hypocrea atroviridis (strain ATCC 20476 / IMI 206040) TaxID=452589 RepID=G9P2D1_HYPAI|nr:uncharacterized protein TRIATDRAFT_300773 [Trichoderma atroviride IMI 206040]EHK42670.1 hypothetical protein TRIATDRAFT_258103 [Trichoderma atroviride IMI 206040]
MYKENDKPEFHPIPSHPLQFTVNPLKKKKIFYKTNRLAKRQKNSNRTLNHHNQQSTPLPMTNARLFSLPKEALRHLGPAKKPGVSRSWQ